VARPDAALAACRHVPASEARPGSAQGRLAVDTDNPTRAPGIYRRAGPDVLFSMHAWRKDLADPGPALVSAAPSGP
jgi:hypothetical protein